MKEQYKKELEKIEVPQSLLDSTLALMREETQQDTLQVNPELLPSPKKNHNIKKWIALASTFVVAASFFIVISQSLSTTQYTEGTDYIIYEQIEPSSGGNHFSANENNSFTIQDITDAKKKFPPQLFELNGFTILDSSYTKEIFFIVQREDGAEISIEILLNEQLDIQTNSVINETPVLLQKTQDGWIAEFFKDGDSYSVTGTNLTEEHFYLYLKELI